MYLAIDYGKKRIGLALGRMIPHGAGVLDGSLSEDELATQIADLCKENEVEEIIIGMPIRSGGEEGTLASEIRAFAQVISRVTQLPVIFEPEQFTSTEAALQLKEMGISVKERGTIDEMAATLLLEQFLHHRQGGNV